MKEFTWKVESVNTEAATMVVEYKQDDKTSMLNIPMVPTGVEPNDHVALYVPFKPEKNLDEFVQLEVGYEGTVVPQAMEPESEEAAQATKVNGGWNEEYIRALIYQVLDEREENKS